jgi:hypothetical protein
MNPSLRRGVPACRRDKEKAGKLGFRNTNPLKMPPHFPRNPGGKAEGWRYRSG